MMRWEGLPKEIQKRLLDLQEEQGNPRNKNVFISTLSTGKEYGGVTWNETSEGDNFWRYIINDGNFDVFYEKYPQERLFWMKPGDTKVRKKLIIDLGPLYIDRYIVEDGLGDWDYFRFSELVIEGLEITDDTDTTK